MLIIIKTISFLLSLLPLKARRSILSFLTRFVFAVNSKLEKVSLCNLELAFPGSDLSWKHKIIRESCESVARLVTDILRFNEIKETEILSSVKFPEEKKFFDLLSSGRPVILASGHLGNFELLARAIAQRGAKLGVVAREFRPKSLDEWWTRQRESCGNSVIPRDGALKTAIRFLKNKKPVGILFDQNITRQFADFVDWFGRPAATSKLIGLLASRHKALVIVISIRYDGDNKYTAVYKVKDFDSIYEDTELSADRKSYLITEAISADYVDMIKENPGEWFWMHKRWKTAPEGQPEDFYN